jgi:hypothetical protein
MQSKVKKTEDSLGFFPYVLVCHVKNVTYKKSVENMNNEGHF